MTEEEVLRARAALEHAFVDRAARTMAAHDRPPRGLLEAAGRVLAAALIGVGSGLREGLAKLHDGRPGDIVFGTPVEARAWRALRDHGDAEFFLQVHGHRSGLEAVIDKLDGLLTSWRTRQRGRTPTRMTRAHKRLRPSPGSGTSATGNAPATFDPSRSRSFANGRIQFRKSGNGGACARSCARPGAPGGRAAIRRRPLGPCPKE